jgi:cell division protease FtsH
MSGPGSMGGGGIFSVGKSKAQVYEKDNRVQVTFKDVAGLSEAKQEVQEIVEFLKNPQKFTNLGGKIPKGALLVGPPGTGKTLLAKAVAGEADVPFFSMSGSDFVEMFVGVGASRVRDLFHQAKEKAPCIIFIDEIDAVGRARGKNPNMGSNDERENTLNQLLTEMDGFGTNSGVIILAATNRADILDKALLRAGRFDRQIHVDLPELNDRIEIFNVHLRPLHLDPNVDVKLLARQTPGFSGADIANVCNEAALIAARRGKTQVEKQDFNDAVDRIIGGLEKKSKVMTRDEKHAIAVHEAGHATLSWHLQYASPLVKVTIVPRGKALGAAWYMPEERQITTKEQMLDELCATLGGRAAEELFLGRISSGAANDLERVTKQAYAMVVYYGMSQQLPNVCYYDSTGQDYGFTKPYSEERAKVIDQEISALIQEQYERAKVMLKQYAEGHAQLTQVLMEREVIFTEDVEHIFGARPWASRSEEIMQDQQSGASPDEETPAAQSTPQEPSTTDTASH